MEFHEFANIFPMMGEAELDSLRRDIQENGIREPVWLFEDKILDGRNRWMACLTSGVKPPTKTFVGSREEALSFVRSENLERRHLTGGQATMCGLEFEELFAKLKAKAAEEQRKGGQEAGRGRPKQVTQLVEKPNAKNDKSTDAKLAEIVGTNRTYIADGRKVKAADPELAAKVKAGEVSLKRAAKQVKQAAKAKEDKKAAEKAKAVIAVTEDANGVFLGNSFDLARSIPDESVALIFTDPPYDRNSLHWFRDLGLLASRILVDGGSLITFCGQYVLPEVLSLVAPDIPDDEDWAKIELTWPEVYDSEGDRVWSHLSMNFFWVACCLHTGDTAQMREYGVKVKWKPMLWFVKGSFRRDRETWVEDLIVSKQEKESHPWQQSVVEARHFIETLSSPGELIVDPFCGGGTTAVAAKQCGRSWWTADVDPRHVETARKRLA